MNVYKYCIQYTLGKRYAFVECDLRLLGNRSKLTFKLRNSSRVFLCISFDSPWIMDIWIQYMYIRKFLSSYIGVYSSNEKFEKLLTQCLYYLSICQQCKYRIYTGKPLHIQYRNPKTKSLDSNRLIKSKRPFVNTTRTDCYHH